MEKFVEVKSANVNGVFKILANKGVCWQVEGEDGPFLVQKRQVVRGPWEEETEEEAAAAEEALNTAPPSSLAGQLAAAMTAANPAPKAQGTAERNSRERDPDVLTLKELCAELNLEPRIARRKLRKEVGHVGTGARWEWKKDSPELAKVRQALAAPNAAPDAADDAE